MRFELESAVPLRNLLAPLGGSSPKEDIHILGVADFGARGRGFLSFFNRSDGPIDARGGVIFIPLQGQVQSGHGIAFENPRLTFIRTLQWLKETVGFHEGNEGYVHPTAVVHETAIVDDGASVGPRSIIGPYCVLKSCVSIGSDCTLISHVSVGESGYGYESVAESPPIHFPHLGSVFIGDRVTIGSFSAIARGTLRNTVLGNNVKIDNLVHIAHNCEIEEAAMIVAAAEVSGSVRIGKGAWIGPNSSIRDGLAVGDGAIVGIGANVITDVPPGAVVGGNPARALRQRDLSS